MNKKIGHLLLTPNNQARTYLISDTDDAGNLRLSWERPTGNSYLVIGEKKAMLIDSAVDSDALYEYAASLVNVPVALYCTHGHDDHIYHIEQYPEMFLHPADVDLAINGAIKREKLNLPPVTFLSGGNTIDLGGRVLDVISLPGHTNGSVLFYDRICKILFSGDTVSRHLLYLTSIPVEEFCASLEKLKQYDISKIFSAHDCLSLHPDFIDFERDALMNKLPLSTETWCFDGLPPMKRLTLGKKEEERFFDLAIVVKE